MKQAGEGEHHKEGNTNPVVKLFYENRLFFGYLCVGAEFFYIFLYCVRHPWRNSDDKVHRCCSHDATLFHSQVYFLDPSTTAYTVVYALCFYVCLPGCLLKQFVNFVQLGAAATSIAEKDARQHNSSKK